MFNINNINQQVADAKCCSGCLFHLKRKIISGENNGRSELGTNGDAGGSTHQVCHFYFIYFLGEGGSQWEFQVKEFSFSTTGRKILDNGGIVSIRTHVGPSPAPPLFLLAADDTAVKYECLLVTSHTHTDSGRQQRKKQHTRTVTRTHTCVSVSVFHPLCPRVSAPLSAYEMMNTGRCL